LPCYSTVCGFPPSYPIEFKTVWWAHQVPQRGPGPGPAAGVAL